MRKLNPKLKKIILDRLFEHEPLTLLNPNELVVLANVALLGLNIREKTNNNDGDLIALIQDTIGASENEPWCMSLQQTCVAFAEEISGQKSDLPASESTVTVATEAPEWLEVPVRESKPGDIWIWRKGKQWLGHAGCFFEWMPGSSKAIIIEGNTTSGTNSKGKIIREGGGLYSVERPITPIGDMRLIAVLRAFPNVSES